MNIYEVVFLGSHGEPDAEDTIYLVRALDFRSAIEEVVRNCSPWDHNGCRSKFADAIYEVGRDLSPFADKHPTVLRGPYFAFATNFGWRSWSRKADGPALAGGFIEDQIVEPGTAPNGGPGMPFYIRLAEGPPSVS